MFTGSLPHNRAYVSAFYDGPLGTWPAGSYIGATVHYTGQYEDDNIDLTGSSKPQEPRSGPFPQRARKVSEWVTLDLIASDTFNLPAPALAQGQAWLRRAGKRSSCAMVRKRMFCRFPQPRQSLWMARLAHGTMLTVGMQNVFDSDPPFGAGVFENNYDESLATIKGPYP